MVMVIPTPEYVCNFHLTFHSFSPSLSWTITIQINSFPSGLVSLKIVSHAYQ
jgi:hypothetical protein